MKRILALSLFVVAGGLLTIIVTQRVFAAPMSALLAGPVSAGDTGCDGTLAGVHIDGNVIVTGDCTIEESTVDGNILQADAGADWSITILGSTVDGNVENKGGGDVWVTLDVGNSFNGNILDDGAGSVDVEVNEGGSFKGNIEEKGDGDVDTCGEGTFNGNTKEQDGGSCSNCITDFNGNACE